MPLGGGGYTETVSPARHACIGSLSSPNQGYPTLIRSWPEAGLAGLAWGFRSSGDSGHGIPSPELDLLVESECDAVAVG
jgi:hypothetical protein